MRKIVKYKLENKMVQTINVHRYAKILTVGLAVESGSCDKIVIWMLVNPDIEKRRRTFRIYCEGWVIDEKEIDSCKYIGTVGGVHDAGAIRHIFEVK